MSNPKRKSINSDTADSKKFAHHLLNYYVGFTRVVKQRERNTRNIIFFKHMRT